MILVRCLAPLLLVSSLLAQDGTLTAHDVADLRSVGSVAVSPDGRSIAFTLVVPRGADEPDGPAWTELHLMPFDGGESRGYVTGRVAVGSMGWTPDSKNILFSSRRDGDQATALHSIPVDGGEAVKLFEPPASIRSWALSPDGKRLAYTFSAPESEARRKEKAAGFTRVAYEEEEEAPVLLHLRDLASGEERALEVSGAPWEMAFDPAGERLALWVSPTPRIDDRYMHRRLHVCDLASGKTRRVTDNPGKVGNLAWSPDGTRIAFVGALDVHDPLESGIVVVPAEGGEARRLTAADYEGHASDVAWIDDGTLAFLVHEGCTTGICSQDAAGGPHRWLVRPGAAVWAGYDLGGPTPRTRLALAGNTRTHPTEVFSRDLKRRDLMGPKRLTDSNPRLADFRLAPQEIVEYEARDGLRIQGLLILPMDRKDDERVPLITVVHGGPEACYSDGWLTAYSMPGQVAAAAGYAVFYPNYRSSTGRGVAFSKLGQTRSGREEFDDVVDGVDHLVERGLVDRDRVGITGGSYGGYASAWGATYYSDRFAASVMFVGISDQISKVFTTDIPDESFLVHWRMRPWGNWQTYLEASPIYYVPRAKTPILICHGEEDPRVSVTQSMELYRALKVKGDVPVRLVLYPGEGHGNRKRAARLDYALRQMRWFNHYLKGRPEAMPPVAIDYARPQGG